MKFSHLLLAAGICSFSAAQAQTTPAQAPAQRSPTTLTPSSAAPALNPNSAANTRSNVPAAGVPGAVDSTPLPAKDKRATKDSKHKSSMSSGDGKMKHKM